MTPLFRDQALILGIYIYIYIYIFGIYIFIFIFCWVWLIMRYHGYIMSIVLYFDVVSTIVAEEGLVQLGAQQKEAGHRKR